MGRWFGWRWIQEPANQLWHIRHIYIDCWRGSERPALQPTASVLKTYTGERIKPLGEVWIDVNYEGQNQCLPLLVTPGDGVTLLGRNWMNRLQLNWKGLLPITPKGDLVVHRLSEDEFGELFKEELGTWKDVQVSLVVKPNAIPKFCKARSLPFAMRDKVEKELERLQAGGIISEVKTSQWAAPIVPVMKADGSVRLCGDYKITINPELIVDRYPLPTPEDIFATLAGGVLFSKLDMSHAYQQLELADDSKEFLTINTHKGLFRFDRLTYGVASAPGEFQRTLETELKGIDGVAIYLDDILVTGKSVEAHDTAVCAVMERLQKVGARLKKAKCIIGAKEVEYLGHRLTAQGIMPLQEKVEAIVKAPIPENVQQLQAYLGMLVYYDKFQPKLSDVLEPLHLLLRKGVEWQWEQEQQKAFEASKKLLLSAPVLVHYDTVKPLRLTVDSSAYGVGAVLSHVDDYEDENDQPIAFKSRKLSQAERNYSQLDKEALAIMFGIKKFHKYVYGRPFQIVTDHKPLLGLLGERKAIPVTASPRLQRWAITLTGYDYRLIYKPGSAIANADALSRLPLPDMPADVRVPVPGEAIRVMDVLDTTPVTCDQIRLWTLHDPILGKVLQALKEGANSIEGDQFQPYSRRLEEMCLEDGIIMWGARVVVPEKGRNILLSELHEGHPGMARMKALARGFIWWPKMDGDIEEAVKKCKNCQEVQQLPGEAPLHPWEFADKPWSRLHMDYAGPFLGKMFLVIIDSVTKWLDVHVVASATSASTIEKCRITFANQGLPRMVVTEVGAVFTSEELSTFMLQNGIKLIHTAHFILVLMGWLKMQLKHSRRV